MSMLPLVMEVPLRIDCGHGPLLLDRLLVGLCQLERERRLLSRVSHIGRLL